MLSVVEALERVRSGFTVLEAEDIPLAEGLGRVLAQDLAARLTHPPAAVSAMDGYAVRAADVSDVPVTLQMIGQSQAGAGFGGTVGPGETARIFTGAPLPAGTDAIVIQEDTDTDGSAITMKESVSAGRFVREAGMDFKTGDVLLEAGTLLSARALGLAAAMNHPHLPVRRRPRVAFTATGDEVVMPGEPVGPDQIVSSNSVAVAAYIEALGGTPMDLGIARDSEDSLRTIISRAAGADLLVTMGGASVGDYDLVRKVLGEDGMDLNFYKIAMRPGKPLIFGALGDLPVLGLPGNPVSAGVTSVIFLRAAMDVMLGFNDDSWHGTVRLGADLPANGRREDYMRARLTLNSDGESVAAPFDRQDSAMQARFAEADCLIIRGPGAPPAKTGDRTPVLFLRRGRETF